MLWIFFRKGILKNKQPTGMSLCCLFTYTCAFPGLLATFILTDDGMDGMGWMGWSVHFFFGPYLENYFIIFLNCFSSLKYMFQQFFLEYSRKKIGMFFFSKSFAKIGGWFFFRLFEHKFANFSKTTWYFFLIVFGPLRRDFKTSSAKKSKKKSIFKFFKKFRTIQFFTIFCHFSILKVLKWFLL